MKMRVLIAISWCTVIPARLLIMARLAQALPVAPLPEQFLVTAMRDDVIHHRGLGVLVSLQAFHAQRVFTEIGLADLLPPAAVAALTGRSVGFRVECFVFLAVRLR